MTDEERIEFEKEIELSRKSGAPTERAIEMIINKIGATDEDKMISIIKMLYPSMEFYQVRDIFLKDEDVRDEFLIENFKAFYKDVYGTEIL